MTNQERFVKLINENPTLQIIPLVDGDVCNGCWSRWVGSIGYARLAKVYRGDLDRFWEWSDFEEFVELEVDRYCDDNECEPNDQLFEIIREKIKGYDWQQVIIVNIDCV